MYLSRAKFLARKNDLYYGKCMFKIPEPNSNSEQKWRKVFISIGTMISDHNSDMRYLKMFKW